MIFLFRLASIAVFIFGLTVLYSTVIIHDGWNAVATIYLVVWIVILLVLGNLRKRIKKNKVEKKEQEILNTKNNKSSVTVLEDRFEQMLEKAHANQDMQLMFDISNIFFTGKIGTLKIINQNYVEAIYWITKSELLGNPDAPKLRKKIQRKASDLQLASALERIRNDNPLYSNLKVTDMGKKSLLIFIQKT